MKRKMFKFMVLLVSLMLLFGVLVSVVGCTVSSQGGNEQETTATEAISTQSLTQSPMPSLPIPHSSNYDALNIPEGLGSKYRETFWKPVYDAFGEDPTHTIFKVHIGSFYSAFLENKPIDQILAQDIERTFYSSRYHGNRNFTDENGESTPYEEYSESKSADLRSTISFISVEISEPKISKEQNVDFYQIYFLADSEKNLIYVYYETDQGDYICFCKCYIDQNGGRAKRWIVKANEFSEFLKNFQDNLPENYPYQTQS